MTEEQRQGLIAAGRADLVDIYDINIAGYAGVLPNGNIVDRRKVPGAIPVLKNKLLGIPEPKEVWLKVNAPFDHYPDFTLYKNTPHVYEKRGAHWYYYGSKNHLPGDPEPGGLVCIPWVHYDEFVRIHGAPPLPGSPWTYKTP